MLKKYYTTGMSSSGKKLKNRFLKMQTKPCRIAGIMTALAVTGIVFCAGAALAKIDNEVDIKYEIYNGDMLIKTDHEPFIYDGEYYLPLRAAMNGFGIFDITYDDGEIDITFPKHDFPDMPKGCELTIGKDTVYLHHINGGIVMRGEPLLVNDETTYVTVDFFEILMPLSHLMSDFRLNVIRPTEPEYYYEDGEEVFIGTAKEQDEYIPLDENGNEKIVKRILVDENNKTIAVIPIENQIAENIEAKMERVGYAGCLNGYADLYNGVSYRVLANEREVIKSDFDIVFRGEDDDRRDIAYIAAADFITPIKNKYGEGMGYSITNTYGE